MLKDFDLIKSQLGELANIINKFKSEAVQLRIVELVFQGRTPSKDEIVRVPVAQVDETKRKKRKVSSGKKVVSATANGTNPKKKASGGTGAVSTLVKVYGEGFFKAPRTIKDIMAHCETNLARRIKANEISGKLARLVRTGELKRVKNSDNQYEYTNS
jgi:hypothetical protein